jgi:hypothetical protein
MRTCLVGPPGRDRELAVAADLRVDSVADLPGLLLDAATDGVD